MLSLFRFVSFLAISFAFLPMGFAAASETSAPVFSIAAGTYRATQNVSITDPTAGVTIYYTTNGTAPTKFSALYTGPVPVKNNTTLRAVAILPNGTAGPIATSVYTLEAASAPVFSLPAGTYKTTQSVTITDSTPDAVIYYTTNGVAPTTSSTRYTGPVSVTNTTTLRAVAAVPDGPPGNITTSVYTFIPAEAPVFSLPAGTYKTAQSVTITDATPGAAIYYTTNGIAPTPSSTLYTGPVSITNTTTLRAVAALPNGPAGAITTDVYTFTPAVAPVFSLPAGTLQTTQSVVMTDATPGAAIYYTTNGVAPTTSSTLYTGPVLLTNTTTLRAVAALPNGPAGAITTSVYTFVPAAAPVFSLPAGTFQTTQSVTITDPTPGAAIYYTTNGAPPTTSSTRYTSPISVASTVTLRAIAALPNGPAGAVSTSLYTITAATSTPAFSVAEGTYSTAQNVTIIDSTPGAAIYYSTNGATPTTSSTLYKGAIAVSATTTLKAVAILAGASNSTVASATYTISAIASTPAFSVPAGTYSTTQNVAITTASAGAAMYYTTNGTTPTTSSARYTGPVPVTATTSLKAVAAFPNAATSAVASATYTINPVAGAPVFTLPAGTYATAQSVTLAASTPGSVIYYTTNGAAPTTSSSVYMAPVPVTATTTVKAVAALPSASVSTVASATYTITAAGSAPVFSVPAGSYSTNQNVTITTSLKGAAIYYTTTGIAPTTSSALYQGAVPVTKNMTLRAISALPNTSPSPVTTAAYTILPASAPVFNVPAGTYNSTQTVAITDATPGAAIYYTTTGVAPTTFSTLYTGPVPVTGNMSLRAIAALPNAPVSPVTTAVYTIAAASPPVFSVPAGTYNSNQTVAITDATPGAVIYYTTTGIAPTTSSARYADPVSVTANMSLRAIAAVPDAPVSTVVTALYTIAPAATPAFSVPAGTYTTTQTVSITDATPGATIYYTMNGIAPTTSSTVYKGPVSVIGTTSLRAIAALPNAPASPVATAIYTLVADTKPVNAPNSSSTFFGMTINHLLGGTGWPNVPVSTIRLWDTATGWIDQESASGTYHWQNMDRQLAIAKGNNAEAIFTFGATPSWAIATNIAIESVERSAGTVTVTTSKPHALYYNPSQPATSQSQVTIAGSSDWSFNGTFYITGTPSANSLTFAQAGPDTSSSSAGALSAVCSGTYVPTGCAEAPVNLSDWDQYVTQLTTHVGPGSIPYWELWNEPNIPQFWKGDPKQLVTMAEHAHKIIKNMDPKAIILSPGVTGNYADAINCVTNPQICGTSWIDNWLALGGKDYVDVVAFHGYPSGGQAAELIQGATDQLQQVLNRNGVGSLPIWDTESSWARNYYYSDPTDQANWVAKHLLLEQSIGVQRTFWYAYDNAGWGTLWSSTGGLNGAGVAWGEAAKWILGTTLTQPCAASSSDATVFTCGYSRKNGYAAEAIWNTTSAQVVTVPKQFVQYRDITGGVHGISGSTVEISTSPILLETESAF